jgi:hypothetical protein
VAPGRDDLNELELAESIEQARALGLRLVVVAPSDPQPGPAAFARRVQEASDADAAIVFPPGGGLEAHVIDEFDSASFRALAAARSMTSPPLAVEAFTSELLAEPTRSLPPIVRQIVLLVLLLAFLLAGVVALEHLRRRTIRQGMLQQRRPRPVSTGWHDPQPGEQPGELPGEQHWPGRANR